MLRTQMPPDNRLHSARVRLREAGAELMAAALDQGWHPEFLSSQLMLVAETLPNNLPGGEMHDSTCEYACAFQAYHLLLNRHPHGQQSDKAVSSNDGRGRE